MASTWENPRTGQGDFPASHVRLPDLFFSNPWGSPLPDPRHPYDMFDFGGIETANKIYDPFMVYYLPIAICFWILLAHPSIFETLLDLV